MSRADKITVSFLLNGEKKSFDGYPMSRLLDILREKAELTGTKEGCGEGECGACSIFFNGKLVNSCLVPLAQLEGAKIQTIENIATNENFKKIQSSFIENGGAQCGICTPGMIMAAVSLLKKTPDPNDQQIREGLSGNLCRCTGYTKIFESVVKACQQLGVSS